MSSIFVFSDVSVNSTIQAGFGSFLILFDHELDRGDFSFFRERLKRQFFTSTSSTKLEVETVLIALEEVRKICCQSDLNYNILLYTDSQCIKGLLGRREKLEGANYKSMGKNKLHKNTLLYKQFYKLYDILNFSVIKLKGHQKNSEKDSLHKIFTLVDRDARKALKQKMKNTILSEK